MKPSASKTNRPTNRKRWWYVLLALLAIGVGVGFYLSRSGDKRVNMDLFELRDLVRNEKLEFENGRERFVYSNLRDIRINKDRIEGVVDHIVIREAGEREMSQQAFVTHLPGTDHALGEICDLLAAKGQDFNTIDPPTLWQRYGAVFILTVVLFSVFFITLRWIGYGMRAIPERPIIGLGLSVDRAHLALLEISDLGGEYVWDEKTFSVTLANADIDDKTLTLLADLPLIRHLDLANTLITDSGLQQLALLSRLESVNLAGTRITGEGVRRLQSRLPDTQIRWDASR